MEETKKMTNTKTQRRVIAALCCLAFTFMLFGITRSVLAYIMRAYSDVSPTVVANVATLPSLVGLFVSFAIGPLTLKISKRTLVSVAAFSALIASTIMAVVASNGPFFMLLVAASFAGITMGSGIQLCNSLISDFFEPEKRATMMARTTATLNTGSALMSVIGGAVGAMNDGYSWHRVYYLAIIAIIPCIIAYFVLMPKTPKGSGQGAPANAPPTAPDAGSADAEAASELAGAKERFPVRSIMISLVALLGTIALGTFLFNVSAYIITDFELGTSAEAGLANMGFTVTGVLVGFTFSFWGKAFKKWIVPAGYFLLTIGLLLMALVTSTIAGMYIGCLAVGLGTAMCGPYATAQLSIITPKRLIPISMSIYAGAGNVGLYIGPYVLDFLARFFGEDMQSRFLAGTFLAAITTVAAVILYVFDKSVPQNKPVKKQA